MFKYRFRISLRAKFIFIIIGGILFVTVMTGWLSYSRAVAALDDELGHTLVSIAGTTVLMIDGDEHGLLKTQNDEKTAAYRKIKKVLQQVRDINKAAYVYTMATKNEEKVIFVVDAAVGDDMSHIGDEYDYQDEMKTAFSGQSSYTEGVYTDRWGTFKTGYAPIKDSSGKVVAILGVDLSADKVIAAEKELLRRYLVAGGIAILLGILIAAAFAGYLVSPIRRMVNDVRYS